jgi:hypothetical protein
MLILDLGYLDSVPESHTMHLHGGRKAQAISAFYVAASGGSTYTGAIAINRAIVGTRSSSASSFVMADAASSDGNAVASAYSSSSASS